MMLLSVNFHRDILIEKGQSTSLKIIAHGPPGNGKSALGYKASRALKRIPVQVDLSKVETLRQAYQLLYNPCIEGVRMQPSEILVLLDEFEEVVQAISTEEHVFRYIDDLHIKETTTSKKSDKVHTNYKDHVEFKQLQKERLTINSLLRLLQGSLPNDGSIIVATTNYLDRITDVRQALVRPGRLTPIMFDYPDKVVVDQMSMFYFNEPFTHDIPKLSGTCTSKLTSLASSLLLMDPKEGAEKFASKVLEIAETC